MSIVSALVPRPSIRATAGQPLPFDDWVSYFNFGNFPFYMSSGLVGREEQIADSYAGLVQGAYKSNGVVFACELVRVSLFSEARFQFRQLRSGRPGDLFGTPDLRPLEQPSSRLVTGDLLTRAMLHADYGGSAFVVRRSGNVLRQPRPDWITLVIGSNSDAEMDGDDLDAELVGVLYHPGGRNSDKRPVAILPEDVAIFTPIPDPVGKFRGIPWPSVVTRNVMGHNAATNHKLRFFENGATPQVIVSLSESITNPDTFRQWIEVLDQDHKGVANAYKTLYLGAGAEATVVGSNLEQLDFKTVQGADETLIAAASGVGAVVAQLSEGLQGSSLNSGNFQEAMRRVADLTMRPLWRNFAGSMASIIDVPPGSELWYDDRDIPALKDDIKSAAEVQGKEAGSIRQLLDAGFTPESVKDAVISGDWNRLIHSGLYSVQLQPPQPDGPAALPVLDAAAVSTALRALSAGSEPTALLASGGQEIRCTGCDKLVGKRTAPGGAFEVKCRGCGALVAA